ncbi:MAG: immunoglobulin domain-containing protein, partial [Verrucomicrobia bacterium]|nr:immunoglobulin domain-containing protein [Verrucomicrobiota bacterium]
HVLSSTNVALPTYSWVSLGTNQFDPSGDFDVTNPVPNAHLSHFFRLLVGSALPPGPTGPSILSGPLNQTVPLNQNASFSVLADGTPPLTYQWYFNSITPLPGATNVSLTILGVQTNDAGTYSVTVSNAFGFASSTNALLTVLLPPTITAQPTNLTVDAGQPAAFSVSADGSAPLSYQWYFNTNSLMPSQTNATLTLGSTTATNEGGYSVVVSNPAGSATSLVATLTVNSAPVITSQPEDQNVIVGGTALFSVGAAGSEPLSYQWVFNTSNLIAGATGNSLTLTNAGTNDAGGYTVIITNTLGAVTSQVATLTVLEGLPDTAFNLYGFGEAVTGGGLVAEGSPAWVKVYTPLDFAFAISNKSGTIKVIEIMNDLDLGWNEVGASVQAFSIWREHNPPKLHPRLIQTGVSKIDIQQKNGLTIFSANGATIRHATFNIKDSANLIIRNLKFDEMWEWDEDSKGDYDGNDWDFMTLGDGSGTVSGAWIDHCTFTKSYDGVVDIKGGAHNITFSWCKYTGDDGASNPNSFVWQQINSLESNKTSHAMYNFLRTRGFSTTNIVDIIQGPQKTHLIGASADPAYAVTFHHQWFINTWDRLPRLRGGNVHNYNIYVDDTIALQARRLRDSIAATLSPADQSTLNNTYNFKPFLNGSISTEGGAVLVENSVYIDNLTPLRNNQTDTNNPAYTGKIMALDSIYMFHETNMTTTFYRGSSTNAPGDTLFGPVQAPVIPFSWNGFTSLPYSYPLDDPANLESILPSGAGAGLLTWSKTNWLKTSY